MTPRRELERWWEWVDLEGPETLEAYKKATTVLSKKQAYYALDMAALELRHYCGPNTSVVPLCWALDNHFEALRDLSLALVDALEVMRSRVPEAKRGFQLLGIDECVGFPAQVYDSAAEQMVETKPFDASKAISARIVEASALLQAPLPGSWRERAEKDGRCHHAWPYGKCPQGCTKA